MFLFARSSSSFISVCSSFVSLFSSNNVSLWFNVGFLLAVILVIQIVTGLVWFCFINFESGGFFFMLDLSLRSSHRLWLVRSFHFWGAGFFFLFVYVHMFRGLWYSSGTVYTWVFGVVIFLLLCIVGFSGYVLPNSSMSYWAWTVITSFLTVLPFGSEILYSLWGGMVSDVSTLSRVATLHFLLPIVLCAFVMLHLLTLHDYSSSSVVYCSYLYSDNFSPYLLFNDFFVVSLFLVIFFLFISFAWLLLKHAEDFEVSNSMSTPEAILPELYYLAFYGMLSATESNLFGLIDVVLFFVWLLLFVCFNGSFVGGVLNDDVWHVFLICFLFLFIIISYLTTQHLTELNLMLLFFCNLCGVSLFMVDYYDDSF